MLVHVPDHFSSKFRFNLSHTPTQATDRSSFGKAITGWIFGFMLLGLGIFELLSFISAERASEQSFLTVEIFALFIILLALGIIFGSLFSFIRYKKIRFDGKNFTIIYRPSIGVKYSINESLKNYIGVRLRVLFVQVGLFNKCRYIIDLYHQDSNKIIPLYISTSAKNIRTIWESYARKFKMPALSIGDRGLVQRDWLDLDKSIRQLAAEDKLPYIASGKLPAPENLSISEKKNVTTIKPRGIYWDTFSTLALLTGVVATILLIAGGYYLTRIGMMLPVKYWLSGAFLLFLILYFMVKLFKSYKLSLTESKVLITDTLAGLPVKIQNIEIDQIENVELTYNPTVDRYSLAIISDEKVITFGSRLPVNDLMWLKDFVIRKLIGN